MQFSLWDCEVSRAAVQAEDNVREYEDMGGGQVLATWEVDSDLSWKLDLACGLARLATHNFPLSGKNTRGGRLPSVLVITNAQ